MQTIVGIITAIILFIGTVGVDVFSHTCKFDGTSVSYVFQPEEHCEEHTNKVVVDACCISEVTDLQQSVSGDCCDDQYDRYQMNLDFSQEIQHFQFVIAPSRLEPFQFLPQTELLKIAQLFPTQNAPPPKKSLERCVLLQTFLI